jgi:hypothetical protein
MTEFGIPLNEMLALQPAPVRANFSYYMALALVDLGLAQFNHAVRDKSGLLCIFQTIEGESLGVIKPPPRPQEESVARQLAQGILRDYTFQSLSGEEVWPGKNSDIIL